MQMTGEYILDANILVALLNGDSNVTRKLDELTDILVPSVVFGELYYGARSSGRVAENIERVNGLLSMTTVLDCSIETAQQFGIIKNQLRLIGKPIPENDIWIASLALQLNLTLVTRDAHFNSVDGLFVERW